MDGLELGSLQRTWLAGILPNRVPSLSPLFNRKQEWKLNKNSSIDTQSKPRGRGHALAARNHDSMWHISTEHVSWPGGCRSNMPSPNGAGPPSSRTKASDNGILIPDPGCWSYSMSKRESKRVFYSRGRGMIGWYLSIITLVYFIIFLLAFDKLCGENVVACRRERKSKKKNFVSLFLAPFWVLQRSLTH